MPDLKKYLAELEIDGQLYQLKDATLTEQVTNLGQDVSYVKDRISSLESGVSAQSSKIYNLENAISSINGVDPELLAEIEKIVAELEGSDNEASNAWITLVDKLKGLDGTVAEALANVTANIDYYNNDSVTRLNEINEELEAKVDDSDISSFTFNNLKLSTANNLTNGYDSTNERLVFTTEQVNALKYNE